MDERQSELNCPAPDGRAQNDEFNDQSPEQIEGQIRQTRARLDGTVGAIQERLTVRHLADDLVNMLAGGAGVGSRRAMEGIKNNPVPAALVGLAVTWLLVDRAASKSRTHDAQFDIELANGHHGPGVGEKLKQTGRHIADALGSARDRAAGIGERVGHTVKDTAHGVADRARDVAHRAKETAQRAGHGIANTYEENPLLIGAAAFAVGLIGGLAAPSCRVEDRLMGRASKQLKDRAKDVGSKAVEAGKQVAGRVAEAAKQASHEGDGVGGRLAHAMEAAVTTAVSETKAQAGNVKDAVTGSKKENSGTSCPVDPSI